MRFLTSICILLATTICISTLNAQDEQRTNVRLCAITVQGNIKGIKYESGGEVRSLDILRQLRSEYFKYTGNQVITFFRETGPADEPTRIPVGQCQLPSLAGDYMLIFSKAAGANERYVIKAIPDSLSQFKPGTYRFINLAPFEIGLKLNDEVHRIKATNYTDVAGDFVDGNYYEALMVSIPQEEKPLRVFKGSIMFSADKRILYIVTPKEGGRPGRIRITVVPEKVNTRPSTPTS